MQDIVIEFIFCLAIVGFCVAIGHEEEVRKFLKDVKIRCSNWRTWIPRQEPEVFKIGETVLLSIGGNKFTIGRKKFIKVAIIGFETFDGTISGDVRVRILGTQKSVNAFGTDKNIISVKHNCIAKIK